MTKLCAELMPILEKLQSDGIEVYTYTTQYNPREEYLSLYWFENGRVMNIQPSTWYDARYARDLFHIGVSYIPSHQNGSGCGLPEDEGMGLSASDLLKYRFTPVWVSGVKHYSSMAQFLKREKVLRFFKLAYNGEEA